MSAENRPSLGAETEIALALITISGLVNTSAVPSVGDYTVIVCTDDIEFQPPGESHLAVANGINPSAQLIPGVAQVGELSFGGKWLPASGIENTYNGKLCAARLRTYIDDQLAAERFCYYYRPMIRVNHPEGDDIATCRGTGQFYKFA